MIKKPLVCAISATFAMPAVADNTKLGEEPTTTLKGVLVSSQTNQNTGFVFKDSKQSSDLTLSKDKLKYRSATLGNALSGELGIHSNPFGGGSSAPVVRGQEGVRLKILQNGTDVIDVSSISPDHVVATDTLLASKVELVRGADTLLYGLASPAGVINVVDDRIPNRMPSGAIHDKIEGETMLRYNTNNHEKLATAGVSFGVGDRIAVRVEGLKREADDYQVPHFQADRMLDYVPGSANNSTVGMIGVSYIHDNGHIGASYSHRKDRYGIPGHIHCDSQREHFIKWHNITKSNYYLPIYPHLMEDSDIDDNPHTHCRHNHEDHIGEHNPTGVPINHEHHSPWIDMKTNRYDIRGEVYRPIQGLDKIKLSLTYADYYHDEKDAGNEQDPNNHKPSERDTTVDKGHASSIFTKKGVNGRLELYHTPTKRLSGVLGIGYQTQKSAAGEAYLPSYFQSEAEWQKAQSQNINQYRPYLLVPNTNKSLGIFGLEQLKLNQMTFKVAMRHERQKTPIEYDQHLLDHALQYFLSKAQLKAPDHPDLTTYKQHATSYAGSALWDITPNHRLSLTYSHNERIPSPMELYYQGGHLATSSFEHGNKNLVKEKSDNYELGFMHTADKVSYKASTYYSNFDNYIFNETVAKEGNLYIRRYNQTTAKFYGVEGSLTYQPNANHSVMFFGDMVQGKIGALSDIKGKLVYAGRKWVYFDDDIKDMTVDDNGDYDADSGLTCALKTPEQWGQINDNNDCSTTINVYKNGTTTSGEEDYDRLARNPTYAPRVPPSHLGIRWQGYFGDHWSANAEFNHVFAQNKVATSTVAIKPQFKQPEGCQRHESHCRISDYGSDNNPLMMQPRYITENKTAGYNLLNVGLDYNNAYRNVDYTLSIRANNLLNEQIYIHNSFLPFVPQMGRNLTLGLTAKF